MTCTFIGKIKKYLPSNRYLTYINCAGGHQALKIDLATASLCHKCWVELSGGIDEVNEYGIEIVDRIRKAVPSAKITVSESGSVYFFMPNKKLRVSDHPGVEYDDMPAFEFRELLVLGEYKTVNGVNNRFIISKPSKKDVSDVINFLLDIRDIPKFYVKGKETKERRKKIR